MTVTATCQQLRVYGGVGEYKESLRLFVCKPRQLVMLQHTEIRNKSQMPSMDTALSIHIDRANLRRHVIPQAYAAQSIPP